MNAQYIGYIYIGGKNITLNSNDDSTYPQNSSLSSPNL
jgi:hypothetical protein